MKGLRSCGAVLLVFFLGILAVAVLIAAGWAAVLFIQRGAGTHLDEPSTPSVSVEEEAPDPLRPSETFTP
ncbi:hypothetical protein [Glutamicibacter nicotianae]|uniref:hypothetical protein n=1 Tax=Glutamicibacter nicotianae TaxID=37929 RepID=UPI00255481E6|nr:hypothetical protein [Glutamicibacter nicotianae]WIV45087.1 hypothetical protein QQS42_05655 [Glutamicibacter nicotianae]